MSGNALNGTERSGTGAGPSPARRLFGRGGDRTHGRCLVAVLFVSWGLRPARWGRGRFSGLEGSHGGGVMEKGWILMSKRVKPLYGWAMPVGLTLGSNLWVPTFLSHGFKSTSYEIVN